jgi:nucleoid-associated protein YgaU
MRMLKLAGPMLVGAAALSILAAWEAAVVVSAGAAHAEVSGTAELRASDAGGEAAARTRAEDLARDASRVFDQFLQQGRDGGEGRSRTPVSVAQAPSHRTIESGSDWLARVRRDYNSVIERLSEPTVPNPVVDAAQRQKSERDALWRRPGADGERTTVIEGAKDRDATAPRKTSPSEGGSAGEANGESDEDKAAAAGTEGSGVLEWLNRAYRRYQRDLIGALSRPTAPPSAIAAAPRESGKESARPTAPVAAAAVPAESATEPRAAVDLARKADAAGKAEEARKAEDVLRAAEKRRAEEAARLEQEKRLEEARRAEMARKAEVERKKEQTRLVGPDGVDGQRRAEAERKSAEEAKAAAARAAEARRKAEAERKVAETKAAEDARRAREAVEQVVAERARLAAELKTAQTPETSQSQPSPETRDGLTARVPGEVSGLGLTGAKTDEDVRQSAKARRAVEAARRQADAVRVAEQRAQAEAERAAAAAKAVEDANRAAKRAGTAAERRRASRLAAAEAQKAAIAARRAVAAAARVKAAVVARPVASAPAPVARLGASAPAVRRVARRSAVVKRERGAGCDAAGRSIERPGWYVVGRGDTLWKISEAHYKDGKRYRRIVRANARRIDDPGHIVPCQRLYLP